MSLFDFLNPPMFPKPEETYESLPVFTATDPVGLKTETDKAIAKLNAKAKEFSSSKSFSEEYLDLIGQTEVNAANGQWSEAHKAVWKATACVNRALESQSAGKFRKCIGWYLALWLLALAIASWWLKNLEGQESSQIFFGLGYWRYLVMGALGGIVIAIWGLMIHTANLDFDRHFSVWYWFKPVLGAASGLVAVIAALAGLLAVQGKSSLPTSATGQTPLFILAFLAGFSERFFVGIIDRVMTALLSSGQSSSSSSKATAAKAPAPAQKP